MGLGPLRQQRERRPLGERFLRGSKGGMQLRLEAPPLWTHGWTGSLWHKEMNTAAAWRAPVVHTSTDKLDQAA